MGSTLHSSLYYNFENEVSNQAIGHRCHSLAWAFGPASFVPRVNAALGLEEIMSVKKEFIRQTALSNSLISSFQRGNVYVSKEMKDTTRAPLRDALVQRLRQMEDAYATAVSETQHCENIVSLANDLSSEQLQPILKNGRFRIGVAQKALNLYLKFLWCQSWIPEPPHCPVDDIVLTEIKNNTNWTDFDDIDTYTQIISAIRKHIETTGKQQSLSEWELDLWNRKTGKGQPNNQVDLIV